MTTPAGGIISGFMNLDERVLHRSSVDRNIYQVEMVMDAFRERRKNVPLVREGGAEGAYPPNFR